MGSGGSGRRRTRRSAVAGLSVLLVAASLATAGGAAAGEPSARCKLPRGLQGGEEIPTDWRWSLRPHGRVVVQLVLADFPNANNERTAAEVNADFARMEDWFGTSSFGQLDLVVRPSPRYFRIDRNTSFYQDGTLLDRLWKDAIEVADPDIDFSGVDIVMVGNPVKAELGAARAGNMAPGGGFRADGNEIRFISRVWDDGYLVGVHESGHNFSLPDLYSYAGGDGFDQYVGGWDVMGAGSDHAGQDFFAWHKWKLEWLADDQIVCMLTPGTEEHILTPLETAGGTKAVVVRTAGNVAYVVENRQSIGNDIGACEEGALVYRVDSNTGSGRGAIRVMTINPDDPALATYWECGAFYNAPLDVSPEISTFTDPAAGVTIELVAEQGDDVVVRVTRTRVGVPTEITMRVGRRPVARGRVTVLEGDPTCYAGARVKIVRERYTSTGLRHATVGKGTVAPDGTYRIKFTDHTGWHKAVFAGRSVDTTDCFRSISPTIYRF